MSIQKGNQSHEPTCKCGARPWRSVLRSSGESDLTPGVAGSDRTVHDTSVSV